MAKIFDQNIFLAEICLCLLLRTKISNFFRSIHLSDFGSQEILKDEDFLVQRTATVATSPIKFESNCDPVPCSVVKEIAQKPIPMKMPVKLDKNPQKDNFCRPGPINPAIRQLPPPKTAFTGFSLASGAKAVSKANKAMDLFSDIFNEFEPISVPGGFVGFQAAKVGLPASFSGFSTVSVPSIPAPTPAVSNFGFTSCPKPNPVPVELQDTSFDEELSADVMEQLSHVEKVAIEKSLMQSKTPGVSPLKAVENFTEMKYRPKRVNQLRSPKTGTSPLIASPEGFMSGLMNRDTSASSTPLNRKAPMPRNLNIRRTKLVNRMSESSLSPPESATRNGTKVSYQGSFYEEMTAELKEIRKQSYLEQAQIIAEKTVEMKMPTPGSLFVRKGQGTRMRWIDFVKEELVMKEMRYKSVTSSKDVTQAGSEINFSNAKSFRFNVLQFCR